MVGRHWQATTDNQRTSSSFPLPFAGVPASLGPGLRTASGTTRNLVAKLPGAIPAVTGGCAHGQNTPRSVDITERPATDSASGGAIDNQPTEKLNVNHAGRTKLRKVIPGRAEILRIRRVPIGPSARCVHPLPPRAPNKPTGNLGGLCRRIAFHGGGRVHRSCRSRRLRNDATANGGNFDKDPHHIDTADCSDRMTDNVFPAMTVESSCTQRLLLCRCDRRQCVRRKWAARNGLPKMGLSSLAVRRGGGGTPSRTLPECATFLPLYWSATGVSSRIRLMETPKKKTCRRLQ
jgi:hypothetical protein